jgi:hypothetical protein
MYNNLISKLHFCMELWTHDVYMMQPPGFVDGVDNVVKVDKSIYGLKQAPRIWYELLNEALKAEGFVPMSADSSFWVKDDGYNVVYLTSCC